MFSRLMTRQFSSAKGRVFKEKTFKEAWLSDRGAWPVMFTITGAVLFCAYTCIHFTATMPDARVSKSARKSIFRGELKGADHE